MGECTLVLQRGALAGIRGALEGYTDLYVKEDKCSTSCVARDCVELKYLIPCSLQDTIAKAKKPKPLKIVI